MNNVIRNNGSSYLSTLRICLMMSLLAGQSVTVFSADAGNPATEMEQPLNESIEKGLGIRRTGDFEGAIEYFHQLLSESPDNVRIQVELAATYAHNGEKDKARSLFAELLERDDLKPIVRKNINMFMDRYIKDSQTTSTFNISGLLGYAQGEDSNVNGPLSIEAIDDPHLSNENTLKDNYSVLKGHLSGQYLLATTESSLNAYSVRFGVQGYEKEYSKTESEHRNLGSYKLFVSPSISQSGQWRLKLPIYYRSIRLNDEAIATYQGISPRYTEYLKWGNYAWQMEIRQRTYLNALSDDDDRKNGLLISMGFDIERYIVKRNLSVELGIEMQQQSASQDQSRAYQNLNYWTKLNWRANKYVRSYMKLTKSSYSYQGIDVNLIDEDTNEPLYPYHRQDDRTKWQFGLTLLPIKYVRIYGQLTASHIESNQRRYNYDRTKSELGLNLIF